MAITSKIGQDALSSLTGSTQKAVLFVRKYQENLLPGLNMDELDRAFNETVQNLVASGKKQEEALKMATEAKNATAGGFQNIQLIGAASALSAAQGDLLGAGRGEGFTGNATYESIKAAAKTHGYVAMKVQYNPSSLYFDTSAGIREIDNSSISNIMNNQITQINTDSITTLGMQLIFDDMNQMDAFGLDASMLSTGGAASLIQEGVTAGLGKKYSVRTQVEGLIACLLSPITRRVLFCWSDLVFRGELNQVNANYVMFNKSGEPIRAMVEIVIQQDHLTEKAEKGGYWDKAFTKAFGEATENAATGAASLGDKIKNNALLNITM